MSKTELIQVQIHTDIFFKLCNFYILSMLHNHYNKTIFTIFGSIAPFFIYSAFNSFSTSQTLYKLNFPYGFKKVCHYY